MTHANPGRMEENGKGWQCKMQENAESNPADAGEAAAGAGDVPKVDGRNIWRDIPQNGNLPVHNTGTAKPLTML